MRDFTPITEIDLCAWLSQAAPQDAFEYHRGFLVLDTDPRRLQRRQRLLKLRLITPEFLHLLLRRPQ